MVLNVTSVTIHLINTVVVNYLVQELVKEKEIMIAAGYFTDMYNTEDDILRDLIPGKMYKLKINSYYDGEYGWECDGFIFIEVK